MATEAEPDPHEIAEAMATMLTMFEPIFEAGKGLRAKLEAEGWSPTAAEKMATETVIATLRGVSR